MELVRNRNMGSISEKKIFHVDIPLGEGNRLLLRPNAGADSEQVYDMWIFVGSEYHWKCEQYFPAFYFATWQQNVEEHGIAEILLLQRKNEGGECHSLSS